MAKLFLFSLIFCSLSAFALEPVSPSGQIFGLNPGVYEGGGLLVSHTTFIPNTKFQSVRQLTDSTIIANTSATLLGIEVAKASARLKIVPGRNGEFTMLDLDGGGSVAGSGRCSAEACTFKVTVMNGQLTLEETWVPDGNGFKIVNGSQLFGGKAATYEGDFRLRDF